MSRKQLGKWGGGQGYDYDDYSDDDYDDDYSYNPPSKGVIQPTTRHTIVDRGKDNQISGYEQSWRSHDRNRQTGTYTTESTKEVASRGESFKERSTGRVGSKDEFKTTSSYRVGNRSGYTEYQHQERYRRVVFDSNDGSSSGGESGSMRISSVFSTGKKSLK